MTDTLKAKLEQMASHTATPLSTIKLSDTQAYYGESHDSKHSLPLLLIDNDFCDAVISLQGAQVLSFQPKGAQPWLWLSPYTTFEPAQSIRGGIPVCLPWFGVNQQDPKKPKHGFVRNSLWELQQIGENNGITQITLGFDYIGDKPDLFITAFSAQLMICLSNKLELTLTIHNRSSYVANFSWALHSYFTVNDLTQTIVSGLEQQTYLDNTQNLSIQMQSGNVKFVGEVDNVYPATHQPQRIITHHKLTVTGNNCPSCIIWNPGEDAAKNIPDIKECYKDFICVERGCAFSDTIPINANESFSGTMLIEAANCKI